MILSLALGISVLISACRSSSPPDASKFSVEAVDGVPHIHNHAAQLEDPPPVRLEPAGKIGELEGREDKDILYDPVDAARLPNGDILVLEGGGCTVKRFNGRYGLVSSFGRKGLGPGDLFSPYQLRLNPKNGFLYIAHSRISWFLTDGTYVDSFRPARALATGGSSITQQYRTSGLAILSGGRVILPGDTSIWDQAGERKLLSVYDKTGAVVRSFGDVKSYDEPNMTMNANIVRFAADGEDHCYVAYAHQNRIDKYSPDGILRLSADRPLPFEVKNEMREFVFTSGAMKQVMPWPVVTSVTKGVAVDSKSRIWVLTFLIQPNKFGGFDNEDDFSRCYRFDVFDPRGILQFTVSPPNVAFDSFSIYGDRMYLIDPGHESCVYEYRIVEEE